MQVYLSEIIKGFGSTTQAVVFPVVCVYLVAEQTQERQVRVRRSNPLEYQPGGPLRGWSEAGSESELEAGWFPGNRCGPERAEVFRLRVHILKRHSKVVRCQRLQRPDLDDSCTSIFCDERDLSNQARLPGWRLLQPGVER